jgi:hypothetical protein
MATTLALRILPEKHKMTAADAMLVEQAFEQKLSAFPGNDYSCSARADAVASSGPITQDLIRAPATRRPRQRRIDKSLLPFGEPRRYRNREHLRFVARQSCLICARTPSDPHHIPFAQPRALGRKVSDEYTVPLCRGYHREVHRSGDEAAWWAKVGIEPLKVARKLWRQTRQPGAELQGGRHAETALQWPTSDPAADPKHPVSEVSPGTPTSVDAP